MRGVNLISVRRRNRQLGCYCDARNLKPWSADDLFWIVTTVTPRIFVNTETFTRHPKSATDVCETLRDAPLHIGGGVESVGPRSVLFVAFPADWLAWCRLLPVVRPIGWNCTASNNPFPIC